METATTKPIPDYHPCVHGAQAAASFALKCKGGMMDRKIYALREAPRGAKWADAVEQISAALPLLPGTVTAFCTLSGSLDSMREEAKALREHAQAELRSRAEALEAIIGANAEPKLTLPEDEARRYSVAFCKEAAGICEKRIAWCKSVLEKEREFLGLSEALRDCVKDAGGFAIAPVLLRAAMWDKEVFGVVERVVTEPDYQYLSQISLMEVKFSVLSPEERQQTVCAPYLTRLIGIFKACIALESKMEADPAYGKRVHAEKKKCMKKAIAFVDSATFRHLKLPAVENVFNCTQQRQCSF